MSELLSNRITAVWALLVGATAFSWWLGTDHGLSDHRLAGVLILLVAFVKIGFIGMYFMELRDAPRALKALFQGWCVVVFVALTAMFLIL